MIYLASLISASFGMLLWALWDLKRFSDFNHRREVAGRVLGAWLLLAGAMAHMAREYREQLTTQRSPVHGKAHSAVAHQIGILDTPKVYSVRTQDGLEISWDGTSRGFGPVSITDRRGGVHHGADFATGHAPSNAGPGVGTMSDQQSGKRPRTTVSF